MNNYFEKYTCFRNYLNKYNALNLEFKGIILFDKNCELI